MRAIWRIATEAKAYVADDMSGAGAEKLGGRWNAVGTAVVYASENRALAHLEAIVHLGAGDLPLNRFLVRIDVPHDIWEAAERVDSIKLVGWDAEPAGKTSIDAGTAWAKGLSSVLLIVPSIVVPEECNVLINPAHPDAGKIKATKIRKIAFDARVKK
jgi:RES domain-containing protein